MLDRTAREQRRLLSLPVDRVDQNLIELEVDIRSGGRSGRCCCGGLGIARLNLFEDVEKRWLDRLLLDAREVEVPVDMWRARASSYVRQGTAAFARLLRPTRPVKQSSGRAPGRGTLCANENLQCRCRHRRLRRHRRAAKRRATSCELFCRAA